MRKTLAVAAATMMALSGAVYAQSAGDAGQAPAGTGTNPPGSAGQVATPATPDMQLNEGRASSADETRAAKTAPKGNSNGNNNTGSNGQ